MQVFRVAPESGHCPMQPACLRVAMSGRPNAGNALYLCIPRSSLLMPCASARIIERRREIFILAGAMNRMLILTITLWLGVSATAHAQRQLADQRGEHGDRRNRAARPRSDLRNGRRLQSLCARAAALPVRSGRRVAERHADAVFRLRVRSSQRHLSDCGGTRGRDNGTSRQHQRQRANRHAQRHVGRGWCWRRCLIERGLLGRDTVNGRQRRRRRSLGRRRRMLAAFS